jgi:thioredoxin-like negative regulator of GroEL
VEVSAEAMARLNSGAALDEEDYVQIGAALAGAGRYVDAIEAYSMGISANPQSYKLRRHRAHRYITTRKIEEAYADLKAAEALVEAQDATSVFEMKGGAPHGTYAHWISYHLGIYHYLKQDFAKAAAEFAKCVETSTDNDMLIGAVDWLYNAHRRNGDVVKADAVLNLVAEDIEADQTYPYYKRVMIYKGVYAPEEIVNLETPGAWNGRDATVAYGLASQMLANGQEEAATDVLEGILDTPYWPIWAYVTAESDYAGLTTAANDFD